MKAPAVSHVDKIEGDLLKIASLLTALLSLVPISSRAETANEAGRNWIHAASEHSAVWQSSGQLELPSGTIFIGDPSWGGDYHLRGTMAVSADQLDVWLLVSSDGKQVHAVWLEANGNLPVTVSGNIDFGTDSAYFALGDLVTGQAIADIGDLDIPEVPDSFEFFLPHIQNFGFTAIWLDVPPDDLPVLAVETKQDGGLKAVWTEDIEGDLSGILIDITGRASDQLFLDKLVGK